MHPIFQHDLLNTRIPIFTILFYLLLGNISGNYIFFGVPRPKGHPPRHFNARRKWIPPAAKHSYAAKAPSARRPKNHRTLILLFLASSLNPLRCAPVRGPPCGRPLGKPWGPHWTEVEIWNSKMRHPNFGLFFCAVNWALKLFFEVCSLLKNETPKSKK